MDLMRSFAELVADAGEQHGFHLLQLEAQGRLGDAEDEVAAFHGDRLGVAGDEIAGEFLPGRADLVFVQSVLGPGGAQDGGDEFFREVDPGVEIGRFLGTAPFPQDFLADSAGRGGFFMAAGRLLVAILADGLDRAAFHGLAGIGRVPRRFPAA